MSSKKTVQEVLWTNVSAVMRHHYDGIENLNRLVRETGIGNGSASRIKAQKTAVGLDVLAKIAGKYSLEPWHLIMPNLDPSNPPIATLSHDEKRLYDKLKRAHAIISG